MTVEEAIRDARDEHPAFSRQWTPEGPLLRFLNRWQEGMRERLAQKKSDRLIGTHSISFPLAGFEAGASIVANVHVTGGTVKFDAASRDDEDLVIVPFRERLEEYKYRWGAYIEGNTFKPLGREEDWDEVDEVELVVFPVATELTGRTSSIDLPGHPRPVIVAAVAHFLAKRAPADADPPVDRAEFREDRRVAEERYIDAEAGRLRAYVGKVREVW